MIVVAVAALIAVLAVPEAAIAQAPGGSTPAPKPKISTPLFSARRVPDLMRARIADEKLRSAVQTIFAEAPPASCLTISLHGRTIFRANGDAPLEPASTNKVLTATGVLAAFSPDDKLATTAVAQAPPQAGVIQGNLWLVGGGDAILTTPGYQLDDKDQIEADFGVLADNLKAAGVTEIQGDIVGDDSRYDGERYVPSWPKRYQGENTVGPLSALTVNDGVTGYSTSPDKQTTKYKAGNPPALAAETLKTYLTERGVKVGGGPTVGTAPAGAVEVARIETSIRNELTEMLSWSDNTTAELMNKELGFKVHGAGTTLNGIQSTTATLTAMGVPTQGLNIVDGSGLDDGNRLTCDLLNAVLDKQGPDSALAGALSIWATRGTLRKKLRNTPLDGKVLGKTGTLTNPPVAALTGFETTRSGETLTFSFIQNGLQSDASLSDRAALAMFEYPQAPDLSELVPKAPAAR
jgi:D-alanyl-D-alanine carboxypeptidase/D-alanyl-D-alanine-endopeptidase (penicillin-binding protein 4)